MNAEETLKFIAKQWCDLKDIMTLAQVGRNTALKIKKDIGDDLIKKGYFLPKNLVPMNEVVKYLKINISYLKKISNTKNEVDYENY